MRDHLGERIEGDRVTVTLGSSLNVSRAGIEPHSSRDRRMSTVPPSSSWFRSLQAARGPDGPVSPIDPEAPECDHEEGPPPGNGGSR